MKRPLLEVRNLTTQFDTPAGPIPAVEDVGFTLARGEIMGLVGESGSGKSITAYSIMRLIDAPGRIVGGEVRFGGHNLLQLSEARMRELRGNRIAMIFQDPMMTLNPVLRIDTQMIEAVRAHQHVSRAQARDQARAALARVGIASPDERLQAYPHQFSGGMRQRVVIAIALLNRPDLIIADEPTTALDVTIQGQILYEMQMLCRQLGMALIWITHDLSVIAGLADSLCVMYAGRIVERGSVAQLLGRPHHPYTRGLIDAVPSRHARGTRLYQIPGMAPSLTDLPEGCAFRPRCARAQLECRRMPELREISAQRAVRCFFPLPADDDVDRDRTSA